MREQAIHALFSSDREGQKKGLGGKEALPMRVLGGGGSGGAASASSSPSPPSSRVASRVPSLSRSASCGATEGPTRGKEGDKRPLLSSTTREEEKKVSHERQGGSVGMPPPRRRAETPAGTVAVVVEQRPSSPSPFPSRVGSQKEEGEAPLPGLSSPALFVSGSHRSRPAMDPHSPFSPPVRQSAPAAIRGVAEDPTLIVEAEGERHWSLASQEAVLPPPSLPLPILSSEAREAPRPRHPAGLLSPLVGVASPLKGDPPLPLTSSSAMARTDRHPRIGSVSCQPCPTTLVGVPLGSHSWSGRDGPSTITSRSLGKTASSSSSSPGQGGGGGGGGGMVLGASSSTAPVRMPPGPSPPLWRDSVNASWSNPLLLSSSSSSSSHLTPVQASSIPTPTSSASSPLRSGGMGSALSPSPSTVPLLVPVFHPLPLLSTEMAALPALPRAAESAVVSHAPPFQEEKTILPFHTSWTLPPSASPPPSDASLAMEKREEKAVPPLRLSSSPIRTSRENLRPSAAPLRGPLPLPSSSSAVEGGREVEWVDGPDKAAGQEGGSGAVLLPCPTTTTTTTTAAALPLLVVEMSVPSAPPREMVSSSRAVGMTPEGKEAGSTASVPSHATAVPPWQDEKAGKAEEPQSCPPSPLLPPSSSSPSSSSPSLSTSPSLTLRRPELLPAAYVRSLSATPTRGILSKKNRAERDDGHSHSIGTIDLRRSVTPPHTFPLSSNTSPTDGGPSFPTPSMASPIRSGRGVGKGERGGEKCLRPLMPLLPVENRRSKEAHASGSTWKGWLQVSEEELSQYI